MLPSSYSREDAEKALRDFDDYARDVLRADHRTLLVNLRSLVAFERESTLFAHLFATELKLLNFDSWFFAINSNVATRIGRGTLLWPDERREKLYVQTVLLTRIADGGIDFLEFCYTFISSNKDHDVVVATFNRQLAEPYFREYRKVAEQIANSLSHAAPIAVTDKPLIHGDTEIDVFISHSSHDEDLAKALIDLLHSGLGLTREKIRCTSVEGYKLPIGVDSNEQIRTEVLKSRVLIGLLTPFSLESSYVLFELGARWGKDGFIAPLLAKGSSGSVLRGPIAGFNALHADKEGDLGQFVIELAKRLGCVAKPLSEYERQLKQVRQASIDGDIWNRLDGKRVKSRNDFRKEQFYIHKRRMHYLTPEAAVVCRDSGINLDHMDEWEERMLASSIGESYDAELMRRALGK